MQRSLRVCKLVLKRTVKPNHFCARKPTSGAPQAANAPSNDRSNAAVSTNLCCEGNYYPAKFEIVWTRCSNVARGEASHIYHCCSDSVN